MGIADFFRSADNFALTVAVLYISAYIGHFWVKRRTGNLDTIQRSAIYGIKKN